MNHFKLDAKKDFTNDLNNLNLDQDVISRLSLHLNSTFEGSKDVYVTPMAKENGPELLLAKFDKVFNLQKSKMNQVLLDLEESNRAKVGPRSIAVPWLQRAETLAESFDISKIRTENSFGAMLGLANLRPLTIQNALKLLKNDTNSGLPYYTRKGKIKERVLDKYSALLKRRDPCILFTRTQEQNKTRNVWGFPVADTLNEMRYYSPLLEHQKRLPYRSALISPEKVGTSMTELILKAYHTKRSLISLDLRHYDNSVKGPHQKEAFKYIKSCFQSSCAAELDYIEERFLNIGILTPSGIISGPHGVPSGSTFTNEVDSIVQALISTSLPYIKEGDFQIQGDDGVYLVPIGKEDELFSAFDSFGLTVNREKSYSSGNYAIYLQNLFHSDYIKSGIIGGIYPVYRALNRIMYQERWSDFEDFDMSGKDYYSIRTICILENCKHHPLFKEIVAFVKAHDKYSLDTTSNGITQYVQMMSKTKGAGEILNHQYGDNVAGIRSFETYKLIKELG